MKLHLAPAIGAYAFTGIGPGHVVINGQRYDRSLVLMPDRLISPWAQDFAGLTGEDFAAVATLKPEVVLFGSGAGFRFPPQALLRPLVEAGIGLEVMDTAAACRTFSLLAGEGRRVAAAIIVEPL